MTIKHDNSEDTVTVPYSLALHVQKRHTYIFNKFGARFSGNLHATMFYIHTVHEYMGDCTYDFLGLTRNILTCMKYIIEITGRYRPMESILYRYFTVESYLHRIFARQ